MTRTGFSSTGIERLRAMGSDRIAKGAAPGTVALVARGEAVHVAVAGVQRLEVDVPMRRDSLFRIASMTKPVVAP